MEGLTTIALTKFDVETRFELLENRGSIEKGIELIRKVQQHFDY